MPFFRYRAAALDGRIMKGEVEALNELDLQAQLERLGYTLLNQKELKRKDQPIKALGRRELISILFQLEMLIRAGVPILASLSDLRDAADTPEIRALCGGLYEKIDAGASLSEAVAAYPGVFPEVVLNLIQAGEVSGQLPDVLKEIVRSLKWQDELASQTKKMLMYPSFVVIVITGVVFFLMTYLVPQLVKFIVNMGQTIPLHTRILIWVSEFFIDYWYVVLLTPPLLVGAIAAAARADERVRYRLHALLLKIPYVGPVIKKIILARLADTFALMYRTGIPLLEGLKFCEQVSGNLVVQQAMARVRERIASGTPISESFAAELLFPALVIRMLRVGESTGALDNALNNITYFYNRDIEESIGRVQALIEPTLTVVMGLILGWIMMAVLGPIYDTISKIKF